VIPGSDRRHFVSPRLRRPFPAQRPTHDRRTLMLTEFALGPPRPENHLQDPGRWGWPDACPVPLPDGENAEVAVSVWSAAGLGRRCSRACSAVSSVKIVRAHSAATTSAACRRVRSSSRACSSAWTRSLSSQAPAGSPVDWRSQWDRMVSATAGPGRPRGGPWSGSAIAQANRGPGLALSGRPRSARCAGVLGADGGAHDAACGYRCSSSRQSHARSLAMALRSLGCRPPQAPSLRATLG
jgi:hypothetical protein